MGYDGKIFRPDFQANQQLPSWVPGMGDDQSGGGAAATSGFVDALKARMMGGQQGGGHDMAHAAGPAMAPHEIGGPVAGEHGLPLAGAVPKGGAGGGGSMKSL